MKVKLSRERAFLASIDLSFEAAAQRSGPKVWILPDKVVLIRRFIMKIAFLFDEWAWTGQGRSTSARHVFARARLAVTAGAGKVRTKNWSFRDHRNRLSLSLWSPLPCAHRLLPSAFSMVPLSVWCPIWPQTSG